MRSAATICNPAWDVWCRLYGPDPRNFGWYARYDHGAGTLSIIDDYSVRHHIIDHMGFAIPDPDNLDLIAKHGPIVEMGAGTGYWAWCLRQMEVDVIAFDRFPPQTHPRDEHRSRGRNAWFDCYWTDILRGDATDSKRYPERSLLLVWPYMDDMALRAVRAYKGDTLIYVGEDHGACATGSFFDLLDEEWERVEDRLIPQWSGLHDELWILKRSGR